MPPRNRFESEYKANFKPHESKRILQRELDVDKELSRKEEKPANTKIRPEMPNRALQYKAGLAPSMSAQNKIRYLSEYQKQFEWRRPMEREAPILSAEKMIYGGQDGNPSKASRVNLPKKTEYQMQFIQHPLVSSSPDTELKDDNSKAVVKNHLEYSPLGHQEPQVPAGKPSKKPPPLILPKPSMVFQSEYHANFKSPSKYEYVKGSWVGADPPHLHPPDEKSDSERKPSNTAWYQQVLELREKVRSYRSRAREGSHFIVILKELQNRGNVETSSNDPSKTIEEIGEPTQGQKVHPDTPRSEPSRKSTPVKPTDGVPVKRDVPDSKAVSQPNDNKSVVPTSERRTEPVALGDEKLVSDKNIALLNKVDSMETLSHENTLSSTSGDSIHGGQADTRREAWSEVRHNCSRVIPPYHTSTSSPSWADSDSRSDVTISVLELSNEGHHEDSLHDKPLNQATRKPFSGRRGEAAEGRRKQPHHDHTIQSATRKLFSGRREETAEYQHQPSRGDDRPSHDGRAIANPTKKLFTRRQEHGEEHRHNTHGNSYDDERSPSGCDSLTSDALSLEAMDKRRTLASKTLQRAKRRQAQL